MSLAYADPRCVRACVCVCMSVPASTIWTPYIRPIISVSHTLDLVAGL